MISDVNKVGIILDYSDSNRWREVANAAIEDVQYGNDNRFDDLLESIIHEKIYANITGGLREELHFNNPKEKEKFWQKEFEKLRENTIDEYGQLKEKILSGEIKIKGNNSKMSLVSKMIKALSFSRNSSTEGKKILPVANEIDMAKASSSLKNTFKERKVLPVATEIHFTDSVVLLRNKNNNNQANVESITSTSLEITLNRTLNVRVKRNGRRKVSHAGRF
jgi:hypothetical protein